MPPLTLGLRERLAKSLPKPTEEAMRRPGAFVGVLRLIGDLTIELVAHAPERNQIHLHGGVYDSIAGTVPKAIGRSRILPIGVGSSVKISPMPSGFLLALALLAPLQPLTAGRLRTSMDGVAPRLTLELRLFNGTEEVTAHTRISVHRAGDRAEPVAQLPAGTAQIEIDVPPGLYDVQAVRESDGRALNIRWAQRLVVMPYPDERGRHLEVINFQNGFGALQVGTRDGSQPSVSVYKSGERQREAGLPLAGSGYVLFVLPAGSYDLQITAAKSTSWQTGLEVPLDRTRLWIVP
jgi:hypothetical protein